MPLEVRDAVHGLIELRPREWTVIDTSAFQRLRGIQQLAMTHLVYPGARHSRFEPCVGACHVAGKVAEKLKLEPASIERVRLAGLTHDIGHGPFSHVSEFLFERRTGRERVHESISAAIVRSDQGVRAALGDEYAEWIAGLLAGTGPGAVRSIERDLVAGPADVDKLDYLLRDSRYCGVEYGLYDLDKVIESARVATEVPGRTSLAFHEDGIFVLEAMLLARYHMHRQVYGHKTRIATDLMLIRAMQLGLDDEILPQDIFTPPPDPGGDYVKDYLQWDDTRVVRELLSRQELPAGQVMAALVSRRLMKRVVRFNFSDLLNEFGRLLAGAVIDPEGGPPAEAVAAAEEEVSRAAGVEPHWASIYWEHLQNPISTKASFRVFDEDILIQFGEGPSAKFGEASEVFGNADLLGRKFVSVYLRPEGDQSPDPGQLARLREAAFEGLRAVGEASLAI